MPLPAWVAGRTHVPVPLVIVTVLPAIEQAPDGVITTGKPELALAVTTNVLLYTDVAGAPVNVIVWLAFNTLMDTEAVAVL